jgi:hypothetical protein
MLETLEPVVEATWYTTRIDSWAQPSYTQSYPEVGQQTQPEYTGHSSQATSFAQAVSQETSAAIPDPRSGKYPYHFTALRDPTLTHHKQPHLTTGAKVKVGPG